MDMYNNTINNKYLEKYTKLDLEAYFDSESIAAIKNLLDDFKANVKSINGNFLISSIYDKPVISLEIDGISHEFFLKKDIYIRENKTADNIMIAKLGRINNYTNLNFTDNTSLKFLKFQVLLFYCINKITDQSFKTEDMKESINQSMFSSSIKLIVDEYLSSN